jgi:NADH:ubiquinone oxidoreductase subunit 2 (subunit N)
MEPMNYRGVPQVVYTVPSLASAGLTAAEARQQAGEVQAVGAELAMKGWVRERPWLAIAMTLFLLSLAGIPRSPAWSARPCRSRWR